MNATGHHELVSWLQQHWQKLDIYWLCFSLLSNMAEMNMIDQNQLQNTSGAYAGRLIGAVSESLYGIVWSVKERLFTLVPVADMSVSETQGEKNNGFDVLYHNMKHGQISSKELTEFIRERWDGRVWCTLCLALVLCTLWPLSACSGLFSRRLWQSSSLYCVCSNTQILCWGNSLIHVTDNFRCACY